MVQPVNVVLSDLKAEVAKLNKESIDQMVADLNRRAKTDPKIASLITDFRLQAQKLLPHLSVSSTTPIRSEDITVKDVIVILILIIFF